MPVKWRTFATNVKVLCIPKKLWTGVCVPARYSGKGIYILESLPGKKNSNSYLMRKKLNMHFFQNTANHYVSGFHYLQAIQLPDSNFLGPRPVRRGVR